MSQGISRHDLEPGAVIPSKLCTELHRFTKIIQLPQIPSTDGNKSQIFNCGDISADSDLIKTPLFRPPRPITVKRIWVGFDTAVTAADTNYQTIAITDGTNPLASVVTGPITGGTSFVAGVMQELAVNATYAAISATEQMYVIYTKQGGGMALSGLMVQIDYIENDALKFAIMKPASAIVIKKVQFAVSEAIVAANTNYVTMKLTDGSNTIASLVTGPATGGQAFTAGVFVEATVVLAYDDIGVDETLYIEIARTGEGMFLEGLTCQIDYEVADPS